MKIQILFLLTFLPFTAPAAPHGAFPHIPPDADSSFYLSLKDNKLSAKNTNDELSNVAALGERNLKWLAHINSFRPAGEKLSLTSKDTQRGIPIDSPNEYNVELILKKLTDLRPQMPKEMQAIIFEGAAFTNEPPVAIADYLNWSRELDRVFQSALRWRMMEPWLGYLADRRHNDLRGWYFLSRLEGRSEKLKGFGKLEEPLKSRIRGWLVNLCFNSDTSDSTSGCEAAIASKIAGNADLEAYYNSKARGSEQMFLTYFTIPGYAFRSEVRWIDGPQPRVVAPFLDPGRDDVRAFLQVNIQDEWRFGDWHLEMPFATSGNIPRVVFQPGVTPHVNGLGGDTITMNSSQPLTEYDAQWTIRHEYGHVLGFPDCYVEFYEEERNVIVNYQFDIDNLMCSRRGHIQERHLSELKRVYKR